MPDEIQPALTREEWARERKDDPIRPGSAVFLDRSPEGIVHFVLRSHDTWRGERYTGAWLMYGARALPIMALANAALPEDDANRFTHNDVALLYHASAALAEVARDGYEEKRADAAEALAKRIAALLPKP